MKREKILKFLKEKKTMEEIREEFADSETLEQYIFKLVDDYYIRRIEQDSETFFESVNNEFTKRKRKEIAQLSCYICTHCQRFTLAPSKNMSGKLINIGEAAHIHGDKPTSARFNPDLSSEEIKDINNGIWLCCSCHELVDSNYGIDYPASTLFKWKEEHFEWLRDSLNKPFELIKGKDWKTYSEWNEYLKIHNRFLHKIDSYISKYSQIIISTIEKSEINDITSIRILGPPNIGKKTLLNDVLDKCSEEKKEQVYIFLNENDSIQHKKFAINSIIIIQECSNEFHSLLLNNLKFNGIENMILISLGFERDYKGVDKANTTIIKMEGLNEYETSLLLYKVNPLISTSEIKKIHEWSGGIPGLILDIHHLFKTHSEKLENVEDYNHYWDERLNNFIKNSTYPRSEVLNLLNKISLLFRIPYSWDLDLFRKEYLPYLADSNESTQLILTENIIRDLLHENLLIEKDGSLSIFPPLTSLYIIQEKVSEDQLLDFLRQIINSKDTRLLDSFIQQVQYLNNNSLSNHVALIIFDKLDYTIESLKEGFSVKVLYRLSELFPKEILKILLKILSEVDISDKIEVNDTIYTLLINLAKQADLYFECFKILLNILALKMRTKNDYNFDKLRDLFLVDCEISLETKIDFIDTINVEDVEKRVLISLITTLIYIYGIFPKDIIESKNYSEEESKNFEKYKEERRRILSLLWTSLEKKIDLTNKDNTVLIIRELRSCFLPLYCTGIWKNLLTLWKKILEKYPELKLDILKSIQFSLITKSYSSEEDFDSLNSFITEIKKSFNLIEDLSWFTYVRSEFIKDTDVPNSSYFVEEVLKDKENQETYVIFLVKQNNQIVADLGAELAKKDREFKLWPLIERIFLTQLKDASTDFLNGYTHIIFEKDKSLWDKILSKFEKIDELQPLLYKILLPKLPYRKNLSILMDLYKKKILPKEDLRSIIHSFRKEKVSEYSEDDLVKAFDFYFIEIENPLEGVELHYIDEWLATRAYSIPDQLKERMIEILTSFEKINRYQFYLAPKWDEIINRIKEMDKKLYDKIRTKILEKLKENLSYKLFNRLNNFLIRLLNEEYEESIEDIKNLIIEIATNSIHVRYILETLDINLIKSDDIIDLCKAKKISILAWAIDNNIKQLIESNDIPVFFIDLLNVFNYDTEIIQLTYKSIIRARNFDDEKEYLMYLDKSMRHLKSLIQDHLPENPKFWLEGVIKKLESKKDSYKS